MEGASLVHTLSCSPLACSRSSRTLAASLQSSSLISLRKNFSSFSFHAITSPPPFGVTPSPKFSFSVFCSTNTPTVEVERVKRGREIGSPPLAKVYEDGSVVRLTGTEVMPPCFDPKTNVDCRDVELGKGVSVRIYQPKIAYRRQKLPLFVYFHGGGFCSETAFSLKYHSHVQDVASKAEVVAVSINYRRAPEYPLPYAYTDAWDALEWMASHAVGRGCNDWLAHHVDFGQVFFAGDSAGGNIAHQMALRFGLQGLKGMHLEGLILMHPYFSGETPLPGEDIDLKKLEDEFWRFACCPNLSSGVDPIAEEDSCQMKKDKFWPFSCPESMSMDDPRINPTKDPKFIHLGCKRVLVCVAELDFLRPRGVEYMTFLANSEWAENGGKVSLVETEGEDHVFHVLNPQGKNAATLIAQLVKFLQGDDFDKLRNAGIFSTSILPDIDTTD